MGRDIKVSVICLVYNHEKFLEKCLEGFVRQIINFDVEFIIHDDKSTDSSEEIIDKYYQNYPEIIVPIYQKENQYSKGVNIVQEIILPRTRGKYLALCEGDDYWCDVNKLQRQYDYMEQHLECSLCTHNTIIHDLRGIGEDKTFHEWKGIHVLTEEECFLEWKVHTSSYFMRKEIFESRPEFSLRYWFGDYCILTHFYDKGKIVVFPEVMSVYNYNNVQGITYRNSYVDASDAKEQERWNYLREYDEYTGYKYSYIIQLRMERYKIVKFIDEHKYTIKNGKVTEAIRAYMEMWKYENFIRCAKIFGRIKMLGIIFKAGISRLLQERH